MPVCGVNTKTSRTIAWWCGASVTTPSTTAACPCGWRRTTGAHCASRTGSCSASENDLPLSPVLVCACCVCARVRCPLQVLLLVPAFPLLQGHGERRRCEGTFRKFLLTFFVWIFECCKNRAVSTLRGGVHLLLPRCKGWLSRCTFLLKLWPRKLKRQVIYQSWLMYYFKKTASTHAVSNRKAPSS